MRSYEERAKDFIKEIFPVIEHVNTPWSVRRQISLFNAQNHRRVIVGNGLSRIALITSDYVIKWDYDEDEIDRIGGCENEMELYTLAEQEGFAYLFAKITRYRYNDRNFYIMPRIAGIGRNEWNYADNYMTEAEQNWCSDHGLTDLHCYNYGFRKGRVCIVDYACREESYSEESEL